MSANDITGDNIVSKTSSQEFRDNYDAIFRKRITGVRTCIKCKRDVNVRCSYCGLLQADGSVMSIKSTLPLDTSKNIEKIDTSVTEPPNNSLEEIT